MFQQVQKFPAHHLIISCKVLTQYNNFNTVKSICKFQQIKSPQKHTKRSTNDAYMQVDDKKHCGKRHAVF